MGYLTKGAVVGKSRFYGIQRGPTSPGRSWLIDVTNVSVTPYTFMEDFSHDDAVLSRDNLKIAFRVHTVWRVDDTRVPLFMDRYSTTVAQAQVEKEPDAIVKVAYGNFIREPLRTYARDEVQRRNGLEVKDALIPIGDAVLARIQQYAQGSPFVISSVVVGNVQYPEEVATAVSRKLAATQELQRKDTEIEIERKERTKREVQAQGIANAMQIIRGQLSAMYIQHEAIEAQKQMVGSPNHTVVYIPVGPMGVPLAGTFNATAPERITATAPERPGGECAGRDRRRHRGTAGRRTGRPDAAGGQVARRCPSRSLAGSLRQTLSVDSSVSALTRRTLPGRSS